MARKVRNLFEYFPDNTEEEVLQGIRKLSTKSKNSLIDAFGENFESRDIWFTLSSGERKRVRSIISCTLKSKIDNPNKIRKSNHNSKTKYQSSKANYKKNIHSKNIEIKYMKKLKLSFYDSVSDELKELYLKYYCEVSPLFKLKYEEASESEKTKLLNKAIEDSKVWRDRFIEYNQGLVYYVASMYQGISFEEAVQEGNIGMLDALIKYDLERKIKFSTYAVHCIKRPIRKVINEQRSLIRTPVNTGVLFKKLNEIELEFYKQNRVFPTDEELAELGKCTLRIIKRYKSYTEYMINMIDLNAVLRDSDSSFEAFLRDEKSDFSYDADNEMTFEQIMKWVDKNVHDSRAKSVLTRRFGLDGEGSHTLRELEEELDLSRQTIYTIEKNTLELIRNSILKPKKKFFQQDPEPTNNKGILIGGYVTDAISYKILKMHYLSKMSTEDIAKELGIDTCAVIEAEKRALIKLKSKYELKDRQIVKKR